MLRVLFLLIISCFMISAQDEPIHVDPNLNMNHVEVNGDIMYYADIKTLPPDLKKEVEFFYKIEKKWAANFLMEDWTVAIIPGDRNVLDHFCPIDFFTLMPSQCMAVSKWDAINHTGWMVILDEKAYSPEAKKSLKKHHATIRDDQKDSVVHELVHNVIQNMSNEGAVVTLTHFLLQEK